MINLKVDEAYAFDYLSILYIKRNHSDLALNSWIDCGEVLKSQLNIELYDSIINSPEYNLMIQANQKTFEMVDLAKEDKCTARDVDKCNFERYKAKINLQNKFFKKSVSEVKIGYEKYEN
jgi:hypothetical protein